jgi:prefoldin alpha subunit
MAKNEAIDITKLPMQQLDSLKTQLSEEVNILQNSLQRLKMVQQSFQTSENTIETLKTNRENDTILVPLTSSLYVPGSLKSCDRVMIDVGTGYYVTKSLDEAKKHFDKKVVFLTKQIEQIQPILQQKAYARDEVVELISYKMQLANAAQKATA